MIYINRLTEKDLQEIKSWDELRRDAYEERAAIREYDGGYPRQEAEWLAYRDIMGLTDPSILC